MNYNELAISVIDVYQKEIKHLCISDHDGNIYRSLVWDSSKLETTCLLKNLDRRLYSGVHIYEKK